MIRGFSDHKLSVNFLYESCLIPIFQDNLSFPLFDPDWNADEEVLLLEVILPLATISTCEWKKILILSFLFRAWRSTVLEIGQK